MCIDALWTLLSSGHCGGGQWVEATHSDSGSHGQESCQFGWICWNKMRTFKNFPSSWVEVFFFFSSQAGQQTKMAFICSKILIPSIFVLHSDFCNFGGGSGGGGVVRFTEWGNWRAHVFLV